MNILLIVPATLAVLAALAILIYLVLRVIFMGPNNYK